MGRFRVAGDDEYSEDEQNHFQAQHVYSSDDEDDKEEPGGFWRGPLVPLAPHCPQNNGMPLPDPQSERTWGGSPIQPPSVTIHSSSNNIQTNIDDKDDYGLQPHYNHEYQQLPPPRPNLWFRMFLVAIVAHLLARYGPVAPPPDAARDSWEDFWVQELRGLWRSAKLMGYTMPKYVAEWVIVGVYDDIQSAYHRYQTYQQERSRLEYWRDCALQIPEQWNLELTVSFNESDAEEKQMEKSQFPVTSIVGQSLAVTATIEAIDAWTQTSPLLLYFSGSRGVGKLELARQVAQRIFGHCTKDYDELFKASGPVMMLQGRDFALQQDDETGSDEEEFTTNGKSTPSSIIAGRTMRGIRVQLYESIIRHAQSHPNGTAVILQHVEDLAEGLLATIVQDLTNPSRQASSPEERLGYGDSTATDTHQSLASRLQEACSKVMFVMTSTVGSKTIAQSLQRYGGAATVQPRELDLALMHEIDMKFATSIGSATSNPKQRASKSGDVGSVSWSRLQPMVCECSIFIPSLSLFLYRNSILWLLSSPWNKLL